jgi:hypothetical protein
MSTGQALNRSAHIERIEAMFQVIIQAVGILFSAIGMWFSTMLASVGQTVLRYPALVVVAAVLLAATVVACVAHERRRV